MNRDIFRFTALRWLAYAVVPLLMLADAVWSLAEVAILLWRDIRSIEAGWAAESKRDAALRQAAKEISEGDAMAQYQGTVFQANVDRALRAPEWG